MTTFLMHLFVYLSRLMTKPTQWHVRPSKAQISLRWAHMPFAQSDQSRCALSGYSYSYYCSIPPLLSHCPSFVLFGIEFWQCQIWMWGNPAGRNFAVFPFFGLFSSIFRFIRHYFLFRSLFILNSRTKYHHWTYCQFFTENSLSAVKNTTLPPCITWLWRSVLADRDNYIYPYR